MDKKFRKNNKGEIIEKHFHIPFRRKKTLTDFTSRMTVAYSYPPTQFVSRCLPVGKDG
jgi:hypothetical protein